MAARDRYQPERPLRAGQACGLAHAAAEREQGRRRHRQHRVHRRQARLANASAYHASKWGLLGLSHALHAELRPQDIRVTAVVAGGMRTPFLLDRFPELDPDVLQDPADVAQAILGILLLPRTSVVPELTVLPVHETTWP